MEALSAAQLLLFVSTISVAILTPGPAILACAQASIARGRQAALPYALGLAFGASLWCLASLFGLSVLFHAFPGVYVALKIAGGLYLLWIAFQMARHAGESATAAGPDGPRPGFGAGIALNLSNPKPALFYAAVVLSVFPGLHGVAGPVVIYLAALACELTFYSLVTVLLSTGAVRRRYVGAAPWIDRLAATMIGALGLMLIIRH